MEMDISIGILIIFPLGATFVGFVYLRMFYNHRTIPSLVAGLLWVIYSIYEFLMYMRILCTGECNIRIDLLIIYPILIASSLLATGLYFYKKRKLTHTE